MPLILAFPEFLLVSAQQLSEDGSVNFFPKNGSFELPGFFWGEPSFMVLPRDQPNSWEKCAISR